MSERWVSAPYGKKTFGIGEVGGSGAFFMVNTRYMTTDNSMALDAIHKMTAAPVLIDALKDLIVFTETHKTTDHPVLQQARAALAQARGEAL